MHILHIYTEYMNEKNFFLFFNFKTIFDLEFSLIQSIELKPRKENINIDVFNAFNSLID